MEETILDKISLGEAITPIAAFFSFYVFILILSVLKQNKKPNLFLAFLVLQITLVLTISSLLILDFTSIVLPLMFMTSPMFMFIAPTCYCYVKALTTKDYRFSYPEKYHMYFPGIFFVISFVLNISFVLLGYLGFLETSGTIKMIYSAVQGFALDYFLWLQFVVYGIWIIVAYIKHIKRIKDYFSYAEGVKLKWIRFYILGFIFFQFLITISVSELFFSEYITYEYYDIMYISVVFLFTGYIGFNGIKQKSIYDRKIIEPNSVMQTDHATSENIIDESKNILKLKVEELIEPSTQDTLIISEVRKLKLKESILTLFEQKKVYLNESLTIEDVADELQSNRTYISYVVNECFNKNFYNFVNEQRVKEAQNLIADSKYNHYSMEGIGKLVGFKSKSSFNAAFKKQTGKTPTQFKSDLK